MPGGSPRALTFRAEESFVSIIQAAGWPIWPLLPVFGHCAGIDHRATLRPAPRSPRGAERPAGRCAWRDAKQLPAADVVDRLEESSLLGSVLAAGLRAVSHDTKLP